MNEPVHRINLSAMWQRGEEEKGLSVHLDKLGWHDESFPLTLIRKFNQPTNLDDNSRIFLELVQLPKGTVSICNGQELGANADFNHQYEVTELLRPGQNCIELSISSVSNSIADLRSRVYLKLI